MFSLYPEKVDSAYPIIKETVPQSSLGYATNNNYPKFPPLMSDGRSVTASWQPQATINADLVKQNNITSNWQYRKYLTSHSKEIMEYNFREASNDVGYYKRQIDIEEPPSGPYTYNSVLDNNKPYGYQNSDLKQLYLTSEQLNARKMSPMVSQDELLNMMR